MRMPRLLAACVIAAPIAIPTHSMAGEATMTDTQVTDFVSRFETVLNGHDLTGSADLFTADFVDHAPWPGQSPDAAGFAAGLGEMIAAFPDLRVDVQRTVAEVRAVDGVDPAGAVAALDRGA